MPHEYQQAWRVRFVQDKHLPMPMKSERWASFEHAHMLSCELEFGVVPRPNLESLKTQKWKPKTANWGNPPEISSLQLRNGGQPQTGADAFTSITDSQVYLNPLC